MTKTFHILLTTDLSDESVRAFQPVAELALRLDAKITLLHAVHSPTVVGLGFPVIPGPTEDQMNDYLAKARERLAELRAALPEHLDIHCEAVAGDPVEKVITEYAVAHGAGLIAMATHGRSGMQRVVMGSIAEAVLRRSKTPVLLFPPDD